MEIPLQIYSSNKLFWDRVYEIRIHLIVNFFICFISIFMIAFPAVFLDILLIAGWISYRFECKG